MKLTCVAVGSPKNAPSAALPTPARAAEVSPREVMKLAKALLDGCAAQHAEFRAALAGATLVVRPQYTSRVHNAVAKLGGETAFWAEARALARACGVAPADDIELARWAYAAWRIPPYSLPPPTTADPDAENSRA